MSSVITAPRRQLTGPDYRPEAQLSQGSREGLVAAVVGFGGLLVLLMWAHDTAPLRTFADRLTAAGRITGLIGTYLVLVEVVLMGRVPWLDRLIGMDRLAVWHRRNGQYSISLLVAHAVLVIWGYGLAAHRNVIGETKTMVLTYPDMLAATAGLLALVGVGVVSARAARRRLKYQTWYFIHLYTYIALALSFAHQLATGADLASEPLNRAFWITLYIIAGGLLICYRVAVPLRSGWRHQLRVAKVVQEGPDVVSVYVSGRNVEELRAEAGQFFLWRFLTKEGWWQAHPYSLSAPPSRTGLRITVKALGDHSQRLRALRKGTRVIAEGPYGAFTEGRRTRRKVLLIGAGVGITPLRALFESLPGGPGDLTLLYRARTEEDLLFRRELETLAKKRGALVFFLLGQRNQPPDLLSPEQLRKMVGPSLPEYDVYLCGPHALTHHVRSSLRQAGVSRRRIHTENFEL
jgi:predicted ferric reductase